jgi:hypothetical protein
LPKHRVKTHIIWYSTGDFSPGAGYLKAKGGIMAICPKCNAEIDCLMNYASGWTESILRIDEYGNAECEYTGNWESGYENYFNCPECHETLFSGRAAVEEAKEFLRSKEVI